MKNKKAFLIQKKMLSFFNHSLKPATPPNRHRLETITCNCTQILKPQSDFDSSTAKNMQLVVLMEIVSMSLPGANHSQM